MHLYSVTLHRFRRFTDTWINLQGKLVAIVGPNEAGKSSLLSALMSLNDDAPIPRTSHARGWNLPAEHEAVVARFRLTDGERETISWTVPETEARWLIVAKTVAGPRNYRFDPPVDRPRTALNGARMSLQSASNLGWFRDWVATGDARAKALTDLPERLVRKGDHLAAEVLSALNDGIAALQEHEISLQVGKGLVTAGLLRFALQEASKLESLPSPSDAAGELAELIPDFVLFGDRDRTLQSEFNLDSPPEPRVAWDNFARAAGLNYSNLKRAIQESDSGRIRAQMEAAQTELGRVLGDWQQSHLRVSLDREGLTLRITIASGDAPPFALHERSDGVRAFIALRCFLATRDSEVPPILLVDEAEHHLHYDGQVDVIRMFDEQAQALQVIYTTHSVGCLPADIGRGVRVIVPDPEQPVSTIDNFWCRDGAGVSPLVVAMGAETLPLTPTRYAVISEGPSDALLLPTLIREAIEQDHLPYQIVGGFARSDVSAIKRLTLEAPRVAFLSDGDEEGKSHGARAKRAGVADSHVLSLPTDVSLEDLVDPTLFAQAVNSYLRAWPRHAGTFAPRTLPPTGRSEVLRAWCRGRKIPPISKNLLAEEILRIMDQENPPSEQHWLDQRHRKTLAEVHGQLVALISA